MAWSEAARRAAAEARRLHSGNKAHWKNRMHTGSDVSRVLRSVSPGHRRSLANSLRQLRSKGKIEGSMFPAKMTAQLRSKMAAESTAMRNQLFGGSRALMLKRKSGG